MTDQEILTYYSNLLIQQYSGKPNAIAHIQALAGALVLGQVFGAVQGAYSFPGALGTQLDVIGKYLGVSRTGYNLTGPVTLDDDDYLVILQLASIRNHSDGTLYELQKSIQTFFPESLKLYDYQNMHISYFLDPSTFSTNLAAFALSAGILPKPAGVALGATIAAPIGTDFYGFVTYANPNPFDESPFGLYSNYVESHPWLTYSDAIGAAGSGSSSNFRLLTESGEALETESGVGIDV